MSEPHQPTSPGYVGAVPGQGWTVRRYTDDGTIDVPVIAFVVKDDGTADILTGDAQGLVNVTRLGESVRLSPEGGWEARQTARVLSDKEFFAALGAMARALCKAGPNGVDVETLSERTGLPARAVGERLNMLLSSRSEFLIKVGQGRYKAAPYVEWGTLASELKAPG